MEIFQIMIYCPMSYFIVTEDLKVSLRIFSRFVSLSKITKTRTKTNEANERSFWLSVFTFPMNYNLMNLQKTEQDVNFETTLTTKPPK